MVIISPLHPSFVWHSVPSLSAQCTRLHHTTVPPALRGFLPRPIRLFLGRVHRLLSQFSQWYCRRYGIQFSGQIAQLPFGLLLKHSDGTRLEEVAAMRMARDAGLPVPTVVSYGEHPDMPHAPVSILMTRMPGEELWEGLWDWWVPEERERFVAQLREFLGVMRAWKRPESNPNANGIQPEVISSVLGTEIRSVRVPRHFIGPCKDENELHEILMQPHVTMRNEKSYGQMMEDAETLRDCPRHEMVFTHGDLAFHNLLVLPDGRISAVLDWESAGWYPSYWEFTTAWGTSKEGRWWYGIVKELGGGEFEKERKGDLARRMLGGDAGTFGW